MILYPAIDLKDGRCVRLVEGRLDDATIFNEDPAEQAVRFQTAGFPWIHVVDLNGAIEGGPRNAGAIAGILARAMIPVQVGGGVRSMSAVSYWIDAGVSRVVIGTAALKNPGFVRDAAREYPERIAIAIDTRDGKVAVSGWVEQSEMDAVELAARFADAGVAALIVTDIRRDGLKTGINIDLTGQMADAVPIPVIASGGARSVDDITALKARKGKRPIHGIILGRALYDGEIRPTDAIAAASA
jgi:phosphoribosylformimino-5-aminoimidazole carboxamide ribotide isomerase